MFSNMVNCFFRRHCLYQTLIESKTSLVSKKSKTRDIFLFSLSGFGGWLQPFAILCAALPSPLAIHSHGTAGDAPLILSPFPSHHPGMQIVFSTAIDLHFLQSCVTHSEFTVWSLLHWRKPTKHRVGDHSGKPRCRVVRNFSSTSYSHSNLSVYDILHCYNETKDRLE